MAKLIKVLIDPETSGFSVDLTGFHGQGCDAVVKAFASIGTVTKEIHKPEWKETSRQQVSTGMGR